MVLKLNFFIILFNIILITFGSFAIENKVVFKVNNEIITSVDILQEVNYLSFLNEDIKKLDDYELYEISKNSIIKNIIREVELKKYYKNLKLNEKFIERFMLDYFKRFKINSLHDLNLLLKKNSLDLNDIKKRITVQIMWNELIFKKFSKQVKIDKKLIESEISTKKIQKEFLLSEIVFNIKDKNELNSKFKLIKNEIIKSDFSKAAIIYSVSETSVNGGKIGWIKESSLSDKIKAELKNVKIGEITRPLSIPGAFIILKIEDKREIQFKLDLKTEMEKIIKRKTNEQLNQYSNIYFKKIKRSINIDEL
tara:strand:- start:1527 stop:2453 length:927 start_codon:yes stop_codon:yes gene_type:complete